MRTASKDEPLAKRHSLRQRKKRRAQMIRRCVSLSLLSAILLAVVVFFTPLFNIRSISVSGNFMIETAAIEQSLSGITGSNLFLTRKKSIEKLIKGFAYADTVNIKRKLIPPSMEVEIVECTPAAVIAHNSSFVVIDMTGKILEVSDSKPGYPELAGLKLTSANAGETMSLDDNSKLKTVVSVLAAFRKSGLMEGVTSINFENMNNITFNYENRLDVICGSFSNFSSKLSLFREAITSNRLTENSRGTIDFTKVAGKAVYKP